jgi:hypothetical protein
MLFLVDAVAHTICVVGGVVGVAVCVDDWMTWRRPNRAQLVLCLAMVWVGIGWVL